MVKVFNQELSDKHDKECRETSAVVFEQINCDLEEYINEKAENYKRKADVVFKTSQGDLFLVDVEYKGDRRWYFEQVKSKAYPFPFNTLDYAARKFETSAKIYADYMMTFNGDYTLAGIVHRDYVKCGIRYNKWDKMTKSKEAYYGAPIEKVLWVRKDENNNWLAFKASNKTWKPFTWKIFEAYMFLKKDVVTQ